MSKNRRFRVVKPDALVAAKLILEADPIPDTFMRPGTSNSDINVIPCIEYAVPRWVLEGLIKEIELP